jgi:transposase
MRYELSDEEWNAIKLMLPNKPRGVPRANDRRVLNGIFWVLRSGAPWRDLPDKLGPYTTCYNRFVPMPRAHTPIRRARRGASAKYPGTAAPRFQRPVTRLKRRKQRTGFTAIRMRSLNDPRRGSLPTVQPLNP